MDTKQTEKSPKDHKAVKAAQSMTAGVTASKLEAGATIDLHGHQATITHTDDADTMVQYENKGRRTFDTHVLNSYLDLKTFPVDATFERPTAYGNERAIIEAVTGDCCYQVRIVAGGEMPRHETFTYADFIAWHMDNPKSVPDPTFEEVMTGKHDDDEPDEDSNPFEDDLKKENERLRKELEQAEINGQTRINALLVERAELTANITTLKSNHATIIAGYEEDLKRLEEKATILTPTCKEYCTKYQVSDFTLNQMAREGWQIQYPQFIGVAGESQLNVLFVRDIPAEPAPKLLVTEAAAAIYDAARYSTYNPPSVPQPHTIHKPAFATTPAGNTGIIGDSHTSHALTHNVPKRDPNETRKIVAPTTDPAVQEAFERGQAIYNQRMTEGTAAIRQAIRSFHQGGSHV